jgi:signal transduction histidine kinase
MFDYPYFSEQLSGEGDILLDGPCETSRSGSPTLLDPRLLAELEHAAQTGRWLLDLRTRRLECSAELRRMFGTGEASFEPTCETLMTSIEPQDRATLTAQASAWQERPVPFAFTLRTIGGGGEARWLEIRGRVELDSRQHPTHVLGTACDVTERIRCDHALRASLEQVDELTLRHERLLDDLARAEQGERTRIGGELHDDTAQILDAVALQLERCEQQAQTDMTKGSLRAARDGLRDAGTRLRLLVYELMPPRADGDLRASIASYCTQLFSGTDVVCEVEGDPGGLSPRRSWLVYRLAQEILRNAAKHSYAQRVQVRFEPSKHALVMRIGDDGVGVGSQGVRSAPLHSGLRILRERTESVGGSVTTGAGLDGRGLSLLVELPREAEL